MNLSTSLVDIELICSSEERSSFSESNLEELAQLILKTGGIIQPLILKKVGLERYEVVEGHFEYYAAVRALEIDDDFEMVRAFIIPDGQEELVKKQIKLLRQQGPEKPSLSRDSQHSEVRLHNLESRLNNFIYNSQQEQKLLETQLNNKIEVIKQNMGKKLEPLDAFNNLPVEKLTFALKSTGISANQSAIIAESIGKERSKQKFSSLADLLERVKKPQGKKKVRAITPEKMVNIIDSWLRLSFHF